MTRFTLRKQQSDCRLGFTLLELLVVTALIGILVAMILPALSRVNTPARRAMCANNLRNLALATLNYESSRQSYPQAMGATGFIAAKENPLAHRISGFAQILPQLEQQAMYDEVYDYLQQWNSGDDELWDTDFLGWTTQLPLFSCPSSRQAQSKFGTTNYAFCIGDMARNIHSPQSARGVFACNVKTTSSDVTDGTSNTIAFAEMGTSSDRLANSHYAMTNEVAILNRPSEVSRFIAKGEPEEYAATTPLAQMGRGQNWADGAAGVSLVSTILAPNSPSFAVGGEIAVDGVYSAGSFHNGGVQVAFADGHIDFIDEEIDAGNSSAPTPTIEQMAQPGFASPYGVWGALGTASGAEVIDDRW